MDKNKESKKFKFYFIIAVIVVVVALILGLLGAGAVKMTGTKNFCIVCHTMKPMARSYEADVHGGNNPSGLRVECVYCHLPQTSTLAYLFVKAKTGLHHIYAESFYNLKKFDWQENRKHRDRFTYDSACLKCHKNLKNATMSNLKAFNGHRAYFAKTTKQTCVSCHPSAGHKNLGIYLDKMSKK